MKKLASMKFNTPLPQSLPKECSKAAKIFKSFVDSANNGLDGVIPRNILEHAKGFAIFTVFKAGFMFSARGGTGLVIAKLEDGSWSAPSAIGTAGLGFGGQAGAEMTDFLVVLNSRSAIKSFMAAGSLTLGGNLSIAVGPLGRNGEATGALNTSGTLAAMYSYSKTRGLFGGVSIEGSVIVERQDANAQAYHSDVSARQLLSGAIPPPEWALPLVRTLESCTGMPGGRQWIAEFGGTPEQDEYVFGGMGSLDGALPSRASSRATTPSATAERPRKTKDRSLSIGFPPAKWGKRKPSGSYFESEFHDPSRAPVPLDAGMLTPGSDGSPRALEDRPSPRLGRVMNPATGYFETKFESSPAFGTPPAGSTGRGGVNEYQPGSPFNSLPPFNAARSTMTASGSDVDSHRRSYSAYTPSSNGIGKARDPFDSDPDDDYGSRAKPPVKLTPKAELTRPLLPHEGVARAIALYNFNAVQPGDLSFEKGQVITVTQKSDETNTWWKGKVDGREGVFPANFVEVV